jgi:hypothetical protein
VFWLTSNAKLGLRTSSMIVKTDAARYISSWWLMKLRTSTNCKSITIDYNLMWMRVGKKWHLVSTCDWTMKLNDTCLVKLSLNDVSFFLIFVSVLCWVRSLKKLLKKILSLI